MSEISKKVPFEQTTIITAVVVAMFGTEILSDPSFGTFDAKTVGKVNPPSVDNKMSTFAHATGATSEFATSHVTVSEVSPAHVIPVAEG